MVHAFACLIAALFLGDSSVLALHVPSNQDIPWIHDTLAESVFLSLFPSFNATNVVSNARIRLSLAQVEKPKQVAEWDWVPPFDGTAPPGYSPIMWWVSFVISLLVPMALLCYAYKVDPPVPTEIPFWFPKRVFEESWTDRQCYVLYITCLNWFILSFAGQGDFNPGWSIYVSKYFSLNPEEIGLVLGTGPLAAGIGIFIGVVALRHMSVGWLVMLLLPYTMITNPWYAAFRTATCMSWAHFAMGMFWSLEYVLALNRLSRIINRDNLPKCMGLVLSFYIAGSFTGTVVMPLLLAVDYNLPFIIGNLCQAFIAFNTWLNFRKEETETTDEAHQSTWARLQSLGLYQSKTNLHMLIVVLSMYFLKSAAIAVTMPTFFPYLDGVIGPLSPLTTAAIRGGEILVQAAMHIMIGEWLNGTSQSTMLAVLSWGFIILSIGHLFYEPSAKLFGFFPWLRVDALGGLRPETVWICSVVMAQFLVALGNTIIGIVILPIIQSFFATDNVYFVYSIAPALYTFMSNQGSFVGNLAGGSLTASLSFGQANEVFALGLLLVSLIGPIVFNVWHSSAEAEPTMKKSSAFTSK